MNASSVDRPKMLSSILITMLEVLSVTALLAVTAQLA